MLLSVAALVACAAPLPPAVDQTKPPPPPEVIVSPSPEPKPIAPAQSVVETATPEAKQAYSEAEELFLQAMRQIKDRTADKDNYQTARRSFTTLLDKYPDSKWSAAAHIILALMGETAPSGNKPSADQAIITKLVAEKAKQLQENEQLIKELRSVNDKFKAELSALQQENEQSKKELRSVNDKFKAELSALQQENEQLKKDIQLLKNLEIKLEKREKQLR